MREDVWNCEHNVRRWAHISMKFTVKEGDLKGVIKCLFWTWRCLPKSLHKNFDPLSKKKKKNRRMVD